MTCSGNVAIVTPAMRSTAYLDFREYVPNVSIWGECCENGNEVSQVPLHDVAFIGMGFSLSVIQVLLRNCRFAL